jgi:hypothetical protein
MFIPNPKKLNDIEVRKQYQDKISDRFDAVKNVDDNVDNNRS